MKPLKSQSRNPCQTRMVSDRTAAPIKPKRENKEMISSIPMDDFKRRYIRWLLLSPRKPLTIIACDICSAWLNIFLKIRRMYMKKMSTVSNVVNCCQFILRATIPSAAFRTSSNTRLMNLKESKSVSIISDTGTPILAKGSINHRKADASCSGVVVVKQRLAL